VWAERKLLSVKPVGALRNQKALKGKHCLSMVFNIQIKRNRMKSENGLPRSSLIPVLGSRIDFLTYCLIYLEKNRRRRNSNTMYKRQGSRQEKIIRIL
jgi:hypothetical protein